MMTRWFFALGLAACGGHAAPPVATPPASTPPSLLSADGAHFADERVYEGDCAPAGSRGGCHTITFRPDGTQRNFLFDAAIDGHYTIHGATVSIVGPDPQMHDDLPLSPDGKTLGSLTLKRVGPEPAAP